MLHIILQLFLLILHLHSSNFLYFFTTLFPYYVFLLVKKKSGPNTLLYIT